MFIELCLPHTLSVAQDGEQAVNFLLKRGRYLCAPDPHLAFIDVNMPKLTGPEVIESAGIASDWPFCFLSTSPLEQELVSRFGLDRRRYILKPIDGEKLLNALDCFEHLQSIAAKIKSGRGGLSVY